MNNYLKFGVYIIFFSLTVFLSGKSFSQQLWTIGPMYHVNFGNGKAHGSFAIEVAYWNVKHFPYSIDGGIEFEKGSFRMYSELQTGIIVTGISIGPVLEFNLEKSKVGLGFQGSVWANYYFGVDYRYRKVNNYARYSVGTYLKFLLVQDGFKESSHNSSMRDFDWD